MYRIRHLSLPISKITAVATLVLPAITGLSLRQSGDIDPARKSRRRFTTTVSVLLIIYYTIIITLSLTHMVPPDDLICHLDRQWQHLYSAKKQDSIKRIQDAHQCCGLHKAEDRAWPFPDKRHGTDACLSAFGRQKSCLGDWRKDEQVTAGLILLVTVVAALIKVRC